MATQPMYTDAETLAQNARLLREVVRHGDILTILSPHGGTFKGRAVMRTSDRAGWVINIGGAHGTPKLALPHNLYSVKQSK